MSLPMKYASLYQKLLFSFTKLSLHTFHFNQLSSANRQWQPNKISSVRSRSLQECFCHRENLSSANPFRSVMFCGLRKRRIKITTTRLEEKLLEESFLSSGRWLRGFGTVVACIATFLLRNLSSNQHKRRRGTFSISFERQVASAADEDDK